jgi:2-dehydropantoate 2-reductase
MRIAVMGTGGVGGYFGARLAQGGSDVVFVARGAHLAALREHGLIVESKLGDVSLPKVRATDDPSTLGSVDVVLIAVKLWVTEEAAHAVSAIVGPTTAVLSLQNGVQKDDVLGQILGSEPVLGSVCYIASTIVRPGVISHTGRWFPRCTMIWSAATDWKLIGSAEESSNSAKRSACQRLSTVP